MKREVRDTLACHVNFTQSVVLNWLKSHVLGQVDQNRVHHQLQLSEIIFFLLTHEVGEKLVVAIVKVIERIISIKQLLLFRWLV